MDPRSELDQQGYLNSISAMLDNCLQDSRLSFRLVIASDQGLHPLALPRNDTPVMPAAHNSHIAPFS
jgi:hypothetical protein